MLLYIVIVSVFAESAAPSAKDRLWQQGAHLTVRLVFNKAEAQELSRDESSPPLTGLVMEEASAKLALSPSCEIILAN